MAQFYTNLAATRPWLAQTVGNFTDALAVIRDDRLRIVLAVSLLVLVKFAMHFGWIFLPSEISEEAGLQDYAAFFGAAGAAASGAVGNLYDPRVFQEAIGTETLLLWLYPPPMLFLLAPFGLLSYGAAKILWVAASLGCAFAIGRLTTGSNLIGALAAVSPAAFATLYIGQMSAFFALLLVAGLLLAEKRPVLAGLCIALLTLKPQYGLLVIPFLLAYSAWRTIGWATLFSILMVAVSILVYGADLWRDFFESLLNGVHAAYYQSGGHPGRITLSDAIKAAGFAAPPAVALYLPLIVAAVVGLAVIARRAPRPLVIAYALAASGLVCPYLFAYDYFIFSAAVLIAAAHVEKFKALHAYVLAALWLAPLAPLVGGSPATPAFLWPLNLAAVVTLFLVARQNEPATASS